VLPAVACNTIVGLDNLTVGPESGGAPSSKGGVSSGETDPKSGASSGASGGTVEGDAGASGFMYVGECTTNQECTEKASASTAIDTPGSAADGKVAAVCVKPEGRCVQLLTEDCDAIAGDYLDDRAIILGSLFSTKGGQAATNLPRQQAAALAIEQMNAVGGVPSGDTSANGRPLVLVSCDESTNLIRAAKHLVLDLKVPAIIGPNTSQDTLEVSTKVTVPAGTVVITPTAVASSITALTDNDLTWLMVPSDVQRAPLMISQLGELEQRLKTERAKEHVKLGIVFRDDALGIGTRTSLNALVFNGKSLSDPLNLGTNVEIDGYRVVETRRSGQRARSRTASSCRS